MSPSDDPSSSMYADRIHVAAADVATAVSDAIMRMIEGDTAVTSNQAQAESAREDSPIHRAAERPMTMLRMLWPWAVSLGLETDAGQQINVSLMAHFDNKSYFFNRKVGRDRVPITG